jgi:hypothetical protein
MMDKRAGLVLIAAAVIVAPRLRELGDSPALRCAIADAIRVAEYMAKLVESRYSENRRV